MTDCRTNGYYGRIMLNLRGVYICDFRYDYTIYPGNSKIKFKEACKKLEHKYTNAIRQDLLIDVDGSTIQEYIVGNKSIVVYDDYDVGAVFEKSEIDLDELLGTENSF